MSMDAWISHWEILDQKSPEFLDGDDIETFAKTIHDTLLNSVMESIKRQVPFSFDTNPRDMRRLFQESAECFGLLQKIEDTLLTDRRDIPFGVFCKKIEDIVGQSPEALAKKDDWVSSVLLAFSPWVGDFSAQRKKLNDDFEEARNKIYSAEPMKKGLFGWRKVSDIADMIEVDFYRMKKVETMRHDLLDQLNRIEVAFDEKDLTALWENIFTSFSRKALRVARENPETAAPVNNKPKKIKL